MLYIINANFITMWINNTFNQAIIINKNFRFDNVLKYEKKNYYTISFDYSHFAINFDIILIIKNISNSKSWMKKLLKFDINIFIIYVNTINIISISQSIILISQFVIVISHFSMTTQCHVYFAISIVTTT